MPKYVSKADALIKLQHYCAYQDRCHKEVKSKLIALGIYGEDLDDIIVDLIQDNFLNEERFAKSYARGKFRMKQWGRNKIKNELKFRQVSAYCIKKGLQEIEEEEYEETLSKILEKKVLTLKEKNPFSRKKKLLQFAIQKGYEYNLIWKAIENLHQS